MVMPGHGRADMGYPAVQPTQQMLSVDYVNPQNAGPLSYNREGVREVVLPVRPPFQDPLVDRGSISAETSWPQFQPCQFATPPRFPLPPSVRGPGVPLEVSGDGDATKFQEENEQGSPAPSPREYGADDVEVESDFLMTSLRRLRSVPSSQDDDTQKVKEESHFEVRSKVNDNFEKSKTSEDSRVDENAQKVKEESQFEVKSKVNEKFEKTKMSEEAQAQALSIWAQAREQAKTQVQRSLKTQAAEARKSKLAAAHASLDVANEELLRAHAKTEEAISKANEDYAIFLKKDRERKERNAHDQIVNDLLAVARSREAGESAGTEPLSSSPNIKSQFSVEPTGTLARWASEDENVVL